MIEKMRHGEVNDLGLGTCPKCKDWRTLTSYYWLDEKLPRKERRKCCSKCNAAHSREADQFFFVKKTIAAHKLLTGECDYNLLDLKKLHVWQGFCCPYCDDQIHYKFTLEHIVPRIQGGQNKLFNILLVCLKCNSSKQDFESIWWLEKKDFTVKPKIIHKMREAYDGHGYDFSGNCRHCTGHTINPRICVRESGSPFKSCTEYPRGYTGP